MTRATTHITFTPVETESVHGRPTRHPAPALTRAEITSRASRPTVNGTPFPPRWPPRRPRPDGCSPVQGRRRERPGRSGRARRRVRHLRHAHGPHPERQAPCTKGPPPEVRPAPSRRRTRRSAPPQRTGRPQVTGDAGAEPRPHEFNSAPGEDGEPEQENGERHGRTPRRRRGATQPDEADGPVARRRTRTGIRTRSREGAAGRPVAGVLTLRGRTGARICGTAPRDSTRSPAAAHGCAHGRGAKTCPVSAPRP
jgi:hypothetical protein